MAKQFLITPPLPQPALLERVHSIILEWYARHQRDLPWRSTSDPYAVLISEIMLQQTQVERVLPKYRQFLAAYPTLADLAAAPTSQVISNWVPLGYNSRAVRLQAIARQVLAEHNGRIPDTVDALLRLKGIGRYTAGAIACFAYRQQVATVDTNIYRVLHRIFFGLEQPEPAIKTEQMFDIAEQLMPPGEAYNWNQALMDLGATICTSGNPQCLRCPLQDICAAQVEMGRYSLFPGGTALGSLQQVRRKVAEKKAGYQAHPERPSQQSLPFTSSNRYFRGRIVDYLRSLPPGQRIKPPELGTIIKPDFSHADLPWLQKLIVALQKDGLVDASEDGVCLP
ncbi:MAG TPA: A/G-specific adenine glycosylase [Ktedonobacteraceae bacterium]|nr:A/G-specific adenine glycosylase [Ktedonobacteraceae bacterium]